MTRIITIKELERITDKACKTFYDAAERHRIKMGRALKKAKTINGGKEIRVPMNYGKEVGK